MRSINARRICTGAAIGLAAAITITSAAGAAPAVQTMEAEVKPSKLPKKEYGNVGLTVTVAATDAANPAGLPPKATNARILFDDDGRIRPQGIPTCTQEQLINTTTQAALEACGSAKVGSGTSLAALPFGTGGTRVDYPGVVTAFAGPSSSLLLHARVDGLGTTVVLPGKVTNSGTGDFGPVLDVTVPPLAGGVGAIAEFSVTVKRGGYLQARCKDRDKTLDVESRFTYSDSPPSSATDSQKCKVKKKKRG